jgi:hypothetical protein
VKSVELANGAVKWEQTGFGPGQVILAGDKLVALSDAGALVLIDPQPAAYKELARADVLEGKCWSTPILANGRIYARSTTEAVCLEGRREMMAGVSGSPFSDSARGAQPREQAHLQRLGQERQGSGTTVAVTSSRWLRGVPVPSNP